MSLTISYDCNAYLPDGRPDPSKGIHLILTDACFEGIEKEIENLSDEEKKERIKSKRLCRINTKYAENMFGHTGELCILCPCCDSEYTLDIKDFISSYQKYLSGTTPHRK
jgi:hypothetical protein